MPDFVTVRFTLNGIDRSFVVPPGRRLLDMIRDDGGLTGTKEGCGAGECGACTILMDGMPVPSCMILAAAAEGREVVTVEGLVSHDRAHPVQQAMVDEGGVQCGFCTPGLVMTSVAMVERGVTDDAERRRRLSGNLCRCTGYSKVLHAVDAAAATGAKDD